jgi:gas vesicle protein
VYNNGRGTMSFFIGMGIGAALGLLLAPCSGEDARGWLTDNAGDRIRQLRRQGRRWIYQMQDALDRSQDSVTKLVKNSKNVLDTVASRLD